MIHHGDCLEVMAGMEPESVDAIVTDPPYGLEFMGKAWDAPWESDPHVGKRMEEGWSEVEMADGAPRLRRPSFEKRSNVRCRTCQRWRLSSNPCICERPDFPNLTLANAQAYGDWSTRWAAAALRVAKPGAHLLAFGGTRTVHRMTVALEEAGWAIRDMLAWAYAQGFPKSLNFPDGWGTALKPAWEPIVMARKPLRGTVAANRERFGTGGLNINATRIPMTADDAATINAKHAGMDAAAYQRPLGVALELSAIAPMPLKPAEAHEFGRWPANLLLTAPVLEGEYSRLFLVPKAARSDRDPILGGIEPRQDKAHRKTGIVDDPRLRGETFRANFHPTVKPVDLMRHLVRLVTPSGGTVLDPFLGSGTTGLACEREGFPWIGIEKEAEYVAIAEARLNGTQRGLGLVG